MLIIMGKCVGELLPCDEKIIIYLRYLTSYIFWLLKALVSGTCSLLKLEC